MRHETAMRWAACAAAAGVAFASTSCGGGGGGGPPPAPPSIASFVASAPYVAAGDSVDLTGTFTGVDAFVVPGPAGISSGVPVAVSPTVDTLYTLVVLGEDGTFATEEVAVKVVDLAFTVTSTADAGPGTLRDALTVAATSPILSSVVTFSLTLPATITLASALPSIVGTVDVVGPGTASDLTIDGAATYRVLFVDGGRVTLSDVTLANGLGLGGKGGDWYPLDGGTGGGGAAGMGGALFVNGGVVTCTRIVFSGNTAVGGAGGSGSSSPPFFTASGGGGGGVGGAGQMSFMSTPGGGGSGGPLGGVGGMSGSGPAIGDGAGGGGAFSTAGGGAGSFGGGGGGASGQLPTGTGGAGGFGGGGGGGGGAPGTHGGLGGTNIGGVGGGGGAGLGGAVFARAGALRLADCTFASNFAIGGLGGFLALSGEGKGGALYLMDTAFVVLSGTTTYTGNFATDDTATPGDDDDVFGTFP